MRSSNIPQFQENQRSSNNFQLRDICISFVYNQVIGNALKNMRNILIILIFTLTQSSCSGQNQKMADSLFYAANERLKTNPENIDSLDIKQSIADYTEAIKLNSKFWQAYRNRARLYQQGNEFGKSITDLTTALKYADKNSAINLHDMRAYSYYSLGQYQNAISDWTIAVDNLGNPSLALYQRAKAHWQLGQKEKSCADFKKAIELDKSLADNNKMIKCE